MRYAYSPEQEAFRRSAGALFAKHCSPQAQRELWDDSTGRDVALWRSLGDLGAPAVLVDEAFDGLGGSECDLLPVLEESGRHAVPDALLEALFVGPYAVGVSENGDLQRRWLPRLASGDARVAIALDSGGLVPDAHVSDLIVISEDNELRAYTPNDVALDRVHVEDPSRRLFRVRARNEGELVTGSSERLDAIRSRELVGSAAVLGGLADQLLAMTVDYAKQRQQFGRPIGSFQAVKHLLADAYAKVRMATTAVRAAAWKVSRGGHEALATARLARVCATEAEFVANKVALQVHGGVGFTFEHDLHLWLKRGKALEQVHGGYHEVARSAGYDTVARARLNPGV